MKSSRGMTLIELLVVISIIAVLAAILFPVFAKAREKARQATCQSNLKQISTATQMYVSDYDDCFPIVRFVDAFTVYMPLGHISDEYSILKPYIQNRAVQRCQSAPDYGMYTSTYFFSNVLANARVTPAWGSTEKSVSLADVRRPSETIMIGDGIPPVGVILPPSYAGTENDFYAWGSTNPYLAGYRLGTDNAYHSGGYVLGFVDGHVKWFPRGVREIDSPDDIWWSLE